MALVRGGWIRFPLFSLVLISLLFTASGAGGAAPGPDEEGASEEEDGLPIEPSRTIEFTTREGTWISLDVSPDGKTIVFELLGDLYTLPIDGGEATPVTEGLRDLRSPPSG